MQFRILRTSDCWNDLEPPVFGAWAYPDDLVLAEEAFNSGNYYEVEWFIEIPNLEQLIDLQESLNLPIALSRTGYGDFSLEILDMG